LPNGIQAEMRQPHSREKSIVSEKRNKFLCFSSRLFVARRLRRLHLQELCACSAKLLALGRKNKRVCFVLLSFFRNFATMWRSYFVSEEKNKRVCFVLLSTFRNFARTKRASLLTPCHRASIMAVA